MIEKNPIICSLHIDDPLSHLSNYKVSIIFPNKENYPMSFAGIIPFDNGHYIVSDTRSTEITDDGVIINHHDNYQKIVPSKFGKFILFSTGINELTSAKKTITDIVYDIDIRIERYPNSTFREIAEYTADMFQRYLNETFEEEIFTRSITNNAVAKERLRTQLHTEIGFVGFRDDKTSVACEFRFTPNQEWCTPHIVNVPFFFGQKITTDEAYDYCVNNSFQSEEHVFTFLQYITKKAMEQSQFVGGDIVIWKVKDGNIQRLQ